MKVNRIENHKSVTTNLLIVSSIMLFILIVTSVLIFSISRQIGYFSTMLNETGRIRGGIQRLVKDEIYKLDSDDQINGIENKINILKKTETVIISSRHKNQIQKYTIEIERLWYRLLQAIIIHRTSQAPNETLYEISEELWDLCDKLVTAVEETSLTYTRLIIGLFYISSGSLAAMIIVFVLAKIFVRDRIEYNADHDHLTGLWNRQFFTKVINREIELAKRYNRKFYLMIFDLDHFKKINDKLGHTVGDQVLKSVAEVMVSESRSSDLVARYGGEEFLILANAEDCTGVSVYTEKLRKSIEKISITGAVVTASIGVSCYKTGDDFESVFTRADEALYEAKESGRNKVVIADYADGSE